MVGLTDAREKTRALLRQAGAGIDPRSARAAEAIARSTNTFRAVLERHIEQDASKTISSWRNVERVLKLHAVPRFGDMAIADIRRSDIHQLMDEIVADGRVGTAREIRKDLSRLFNWATDRKLVPANPMYALKRGDLIARRPAGL